MTNKRTNKSAQKREKHFDRQQRKRAQVSKKIAKAKAGHDQWTGGYDRRTLNTIKKDADE